MEKMLARLIEELNRSLQILFQRKKFVFLRSWTNMGKSGVGGRGTGCGT